MNQQALEVAQPFVVEKRLGARWRLLLFRSGLALVAVDAALYIGALVEISMTEPLDTKLRAAAWFFMIGSAVSLIAFSLLLFGYGWKRVGLAAGCLLALFLWYGLTLY